MTRCVAHQYQTHLPLQQLSLHPHQVFYHSLIAAFTTWCVLILCCCRFLCSHLQLTFRTYDRDFWPAKPQCLLAYHTLLLPLLLFDSYCS
jgi:hypothetical protein